MQGCCRKLFNKSRLQIERAEWRANKQTFDCILICMPLPVSAYAARSSFEVRIRGRRSVPNAQEMFIEPHSVRLHCAFYCGEPTTIAFNNLETLDKGETTNLLIESE